MLPSGMREVFLDLFHLLKMSTNACFVKRLESILLWWHMYRPTRGLLSSMEVCFIFIFYSNAVKCYKSRQNHVVSEMIVCM